MKINMKQKFVSADGQVFTVNQVPLVDSKLWVHYTKDETGQEYSCLLEAFAERFTALVQ